MAGGRRDPTPRPSDRRQWGQSMVEFALLLPIFLVVMFIIADFGVGISRWVILTNSTREGARLGAVGASTTDITDKVVDTSNGLLVSGDVNVYYLDGPDDNSDAGDRGDAVVVESNYQYGLITPLKAFLNLAWGSIDFHSCTDMRLELPVSGASNPGSDPGC